jgi:putative flavoprotein involved in K+ transport
MSALGVIVIGAGPAGLAAAAAAGHQGIPATVVGQADSAAASWLGRYGRLRLNTCRWTSQLPRSGYRSRTGLFPSRDEVISYLKDYLQRPALDLRVRTCVERIDRRDGGWQLQTPAGPVAARQVIVATGHDHTPHIPPWPGRQRYAGRLVHAAAYRNARPFQHARVVVAGAGCSGLEIAYDLAEGGAGRVWVAIRYTPGLEPLARHLGVPDQRGLPHVHGGKAAAPGLRFIGYLPRPGQIGHIGREAQRAARAITNETRATGPGQ